MVKLFTPEYKKQCVDMVLDGKHSVTQVCKMMRVSQSALNRWQRQFLAEQQGITPTEPAISAEQREIQRLLAENEQLRSDNALLKRYPPSCLRSLKILCGGFTARRHFPRPTFPLFFVEPYHEPPLGKIPANQMLASLQETLLSAFERSGETYGSRRLSQTATDLGIKVGRFKVRRLMGEMAIKAKCPKAKVWRKQAVDFAENIANELCAMMPNTLWASDITYIPTDEGWLYLAVVIDWFSRLIVGWTVSDTPDNKTKFGENLISL